MRAISVLMFSLFLSFSAFCAELSKVDFDFDDLSTKTALQIIADSAGLNLIGADDIKGSLSMRMKSVTWKEALDYVSKSKGLHYDLEGDVLYISSDKDYFVNLDSPLPKKDENRNNIITLKYIKPSDAIKGFPLYSSEFNTESIFPNDAARIVVARLSPSRLEELADYIKAVDFPRRQVMIEARIVEINRSDSNQLGVNWSGTLKPGNFTAATGANFVNAASLPVTAGIGFVSNTAILDIDLAAMQREGLGRVISRPRVFASDSQQARMVSGSEVPYQQSAGDGATSTSFKEAALSLDVTPSIDDQAVMLDIKLAKDEPDFANALNGVPPIKTTSFASNVRVKLGTTVVLGGVYSTAESTQHHRIPGLASIPWIGRIFRYDTHSVTDTELVLFITPTLVPI